MTIHEMEIQEDGTIVAVDENGEIIPLKFGPSMVSEQLGIPVYSDDANAPNETQYFNDSDGTLKFKDANGTVYTGGSSGGGVSNPMGEDLDAGGHAIENVGSLNAGGIVDKQIDRPLWSESATTVNVPSDYGTIQDAIDDIPLILNHPYEITIDDGDYSSEDLLIPQIYAGGAGNVGGGAWEHKLRITGNESNPENVKIGSVVINGFQGGICQVRGVALQNDNPTDDDSSPFAAYYSNQVTLVNSVFEGGTTGVLSYGSLTVVNNVDFGASVLVNGIRTKHSGVAYEQYQGDGSPATSGNVTSAAYDTSVNGQIAFAGQDSTLTGDTRLVRPDTGWGAFDYQNREWYAYTSFVDGFNYDMQNGQTEVSNRVLDTTYQNNSPNLLRVDIVLGYEVSTSTEIAADVFVQQQESGIVDGKRMVYRFSEFVDNNTDRHLGFFVPAGQHYHVRSDSGSPTIKEWNEKEAI